MTVLLLLAINTHFVIDNKSSRLVLVKRLKWRLANQTLSGNLVGLKWEVLVVVDYTNHIW